MKMNEWSSSQTTMLGNVNEVRHMLFFGYSVKEVFVKVKRVKPSKTLDTSITRDKGRMFVAGVTGRKKTRARPLSVWRTFNQIITQSSFNLICLTARPIIWHWRNLFTFWKCYEQGYHFVYLTFLVFKLFCFKSENNIHSSFNVFVTSTQQIHSSTKRTKRTPDRTPPWLNSVAFGTKAVEILL